MQKAMFRWNFRKTGLRYGFLFFYDPYIIFLLTTDEKKQKCTICFSIGDIIFLRVNIFVFLHFT